MLNRVFRVIWSRSRLAWVAVSEAVSGGGKVKSSSRSSQGGVAMAAPVLSALALAAGSALAAPPAPVQLPTNGQLAAGLASIVQNAGVLTVNQATPRAIIHWDSFNVGSQARVNFVQPSQSSVALNRVLSADPSQIYGQIHANGQVYLVNPAGVYFAPGASVNVGGIVATTHQMADADFMAGKTSFDRHGATGSVINQGSIQASLGGYIAMLAPEVRNSGVLVAQSGTVALAAGERITLNFAAASAGQSKLDSITVTPAQMDTLVENRQAVRAPGGLIVLSAQAASQLAASVVNSGSLEAQGVSQVGGRIVLDAGQSGTLRHSGSLSVASDTAQGGSATLTGQTIALEAGSRINADGATGGGTVLVGGDWQGSGSLQQATTVTLAQGARIDASATQQGNGGKVVLWSNISLPNSLTQVDGSIQALGAGGAAGGQIETSGHGLGIGANASVVTGLQGQWLLDPADVTITTGADSNWSQRLNYYEPNASASTVVINVSSLTTALNSGTSVTVTTTNGTIGGGTGNGDITVANAINWSGLGSLTLFASRNINLNANVVASGQGARFSAQATGSISAGADNLLFQTNNGTLTFWSNFNTASGGGIYMNRNGLTFNTANGSLTQTTGGGSIQFVGGSTSLFDDAGNPTGAAVSSGSGVSFNPAAGGNNLTRIYSGGGNITVNGRSSGSSIGVAFWQATAINAGNGAVNITGYSASGHGIEFNAGGSATSGTGITANGIQINGTSAGGNSGVGFFNNTAEWVSTGSGSVSVTGTSATGVGINFTTTALLNITSANGNIALTGTSSGSTAINYYGGTVKSTGSGAITLTGNSTAWTGIYLPYAMNFSTTTGGITFNAAGAGANDGHALQFGGGNITTTTGHVSMQGRQTGSSTGIYFLAATNITTAGGGIEVNGTANARHGVFTQSNLNMTVTQGAGGIGISGVSSSGSNYGIAFQSTSVNLTSAAGNISLTASAGSSAIEYYAGNITTTTGSIAITANSSGWVGFYQPNRLNFSTTTGNIGIVANGAGAYYALQLGGGNITTTTGNVSLQGRTTGSHFGIYFETDATQITTAGGAVTINGTATSNRGVYNDAVLNITAGGGVTILGSATGQPGIETAANLNVNTSQGTGGITLNGSSVNSLGIYSTTKNINLTSGAGAISVIGTAGDDNQGVYIYTGNISSTTGAIALTGTSGSYRGLDLGRDTSIFNVTSTSGNISLIGRTTTGDYGLYFQGTNISTAGNISFASDAILRVNANVYATGAGSAVVFKSNGSILNSQTQTIQTNNGSLVFWTNANGGSAGGVQFDNSVITLNTANGSTAQTSGGGQLIIGGGTVTDANGFPTGAVQSGLAWGVSLGGSSSGYGVIHTGGGNISIRSNTSSSEAIVIGRATRIDAGSGTITMVGSGTQSGIYLNTWNGGAYDIKAGGNITLEGSGNYGIRSYHDNAEQGGTIRSTGGNVTLTGTGASEGVFIYSNNTVVADVGNIVVTGSSSGRGITGYGRFLAGAGNISLSSPLSRVWLSATVGQLAGSLVTSSTSNISISATSLFDGQSPTLNTAGNVTLTTTSWNLAGAKIGTSANISIVPLTAAGFTTALYFSNLVVNPTINSVTYTPQTLTVGNASSTSSNSVYLDTNITVNGAISVIGGGVQVTQNLTSNNGNIWLQGTSTAADVSTVFSTQKIQASAANATVTLRSARSVLLSGGEISAATTVLWSGYNNTSTYGVDMGGSLLRSGNVWIGGSSSANGSLRWHDTVVGDGPVSGATPVRFTTLAPVDISGTNPAWPNGDVLIWAGSGSTRNGIYSASNETLFVQGEVALVTPTLSGANLTVHTSGFTWVTGTGNSDGWIWGGSTSSGAYTTYQQASNQPMSRLVLALNKSANNANDNTTLNNLTLGQYAGMSYANGTAYVLRDTAPAMYKDEINAGGVINASNLSLYGGNAGWTVINTTRDANSTVLISGNATQTNGGITAGRLLLQDGSFRSFIAQSPEVNSVGTLAATNVTSLTFVNNGSLTIGSVGGVNGITGSGNIAISTRTGDLALTQTVNTTSNSTSAIVLTAGSTTAAGTATGGNITVSGNGGLVTDGRATLYTGSVAGSTGLTNLIVAGSGNFRYNSTAASTGYTLALGSTGDYAIYRESPSMTVSADDQNRVYGTFTDVTISTTGVNGDTLSQIFGSTVPTGTLVNGTYSTSNNLRYGSYTVTATGISTNQLGYSNVTYNNGTVSISQATITLPNATVADKVYNNSTLATLTLGAPAGKITNDLLNVNLLTSVFSRKNVGANLAVSATYSLTGADAGNYLLTAPTLSANITPATVSLSATQVYSGSTALSNVTIGTGVAGETLTYSAATANSSHVGTGNFINAITLGNQAGANATAGGLASNYQLPTLNATHAPVTVTAANLTLTATGNISRVYDGTANMTIVAGDYGVSGLLSGDSLTVANLSAAFYNSARVASASNVTANNLTLASIGSTTLGSLASDYNLQTSSLVWGTGGQSGTYANITAAPLTLTATGSLSRVYDGSTSLSITSGNYSVAGLVAGDSLTLSNLSTAFYNNAHVVGANQVTVNNLALATVTGNHSSALSDYALQTSSLVWGSGGQGGTTASITPVTLTVTGSLVNAKTYTGTTAATLSNGTLVGVLAGDVLALTQVGNFSGANVGNNLAVTANESIAVTSSNRSSVASDYSLTQPTGLTGSITPASLTVTANNRSTQYGLGTTLGSTAFSTSGLQNSETVGNVTLASTGSAATANAGTYNITTGSATGGTFDINNYSVTYANGTLTVTQAPITLTANNQSRTYGAANPGTGAVTLSSGQLYNSDTLSTASLSSAATATSAVGNYALTPSAQTFSAGSAGNYNITYADGTLAVTRASLTVTANNTSTQYGLGTTLGSTAFSTSGLQNSETVGSVTLASTGSAATANAGTYNITAGSATGGTFDINNYSVTYANGTLTVTQAPITLTANNQSRSYGAANPGTGAVTVSSGQLYNSDTLSTASLSSPATATSAVGNYALTPSAQTFSAGSAGNYNISYADGTLSVTRASLTVTANNTSTQYGLGTTLGSTAFSTSGLQNSETIGAVTLASTGSAATANAGTYNITAGSATGGTFDINNYNVTYANGTLTVTQAPLTVTVNDQSRAYGASNPATGAVTLTTGTLYNSDTLGNATVSSAASNTSAVGNYTLTPSAQTFSAGSAGNYNISYADGTLAVTRASLTVTANSTSTQYGLGTTLGSTAFSTSGLQNSETVGSVTLASTGSAATANVGTYNITAGSATGGTFDINNYSVTYANGTLTVTQAPITLTANNQSRSYGAANPGTGAVTVSSGQLYNSDAVSSVSVSSTATNSLAAGSTANLTASGAVFGSGLASNYNISYANGTLSIAKAALGISAAGVYSGSTSVAPSSYTLTGLANGETVTSITSLTVSNANVAGNGANRVTAIGSGGGTANLANYELSSTYNAVASTSTTNAFTMAKATLTVTADNAAIFVSQAVPGSYNVSYSGFVGGQTALTAGLTTGSVSNTASTGASAGSYTLTPSGWSAANYNVTYIDGSFTVVPANQLLVQVSSTSTTYGAGISYASPTVQYLAGNATLVTLTQSQQSGNTFTFADGSSGTVTFTLGAANASSSTSNNLAAGSYQVVGSNFSKTSNNFNGNITYTGSSTVSTAALSVNTGNVTKVYDGTTSMSGLTMGLNTVVAGDVVTVNGTGSFSQAGVGSHLNYSVAGLVLGGVDAGNYHLTGGNSFTGSNGEITAAPLTVTANSTSTQYGLGTTLGSTAFSTSGLQNSETIGAVTLASTGSAASTNVGTYNITAGSATGGTFDINNYNVTYANGTLTVTQAPITLTANNQSRTYGAANPGTGAVTLSSGTLYNSDTLSTASLSSPATATSAVGNYALTPSAQTFSAGSAGNYNISYADGTLAVTRASLTVTANNTSTQYGLGTTLGSTAFSTSGLQNSETIGAVTLASTGSAASTNVGTYNITAGSATGGTFDINNYSVTYANGTLTVTQAPITLTANNQSRSYGAANPGTGAVTVSSGQLYNSDTLSTASLSSPATATSAVGNYALTPSAQTFSAGSAGNYNISYADGTLSVTRASLTVTANNTSTQYGLGTTLGTTAFSSTGLVNSETIGGVTLASTGAAATTNVGTYNITAGSATGGTFDINNYNVSYANGTLTVTQAPITLTANNQSRSYGAANPSSGVVTLSSGTLYNSDTLSTVSLSSPATATSVVGNYALTPSAQTFSAGSAGNYNISYADGTLAVTRASLTVTANSSSTQYGLGTTLGSTAFSTSGLQNSETIGAVTLASTGSAASTNVGTYNITAGSATGGTFDINNYNVSYANGTLTVTQAPITLTANNQSRTYGAANPGTGAVTLSSGTLYNSDTLSTASLSSTATATSAVGNYSLTPSAQTFSAGSAGNYNISYADGTLAVTRASLTVTANNTSTQYGLGTTLGTTAFSTSGLQNSETIGAVTLASTGSVASTNVGTYNITAGSATGGTFDINNYNVSYANGTLTVTQAPITLTANNQSRTYGAANPGTGAVTLSSGTLYNSDTLSTASLSSTATATSAVGNYALTPSAQTFSAGSAGNYNISYADGTLAVTRASLTVTANSTSTQYGLGTTLGTTAFSTSGLQNSETVGNVTLASTGSTASTNVGTYNITAGSAIGGTFDINNYNVTYANGTLTVTQAPITLTVNNQSRTYGAANPSSGVVTLSSGTLYNSDTLSTVSLSSPATATSVVGNYALTPSAQTFSAGSAGNYNISYADGTLAVTRASLTVTANSTSTQYGLGTTLGTTAFSTSGLQNSETVGNVTLASTGSAATANVGTYNITAASATGGTFDINNYNVTYANGTLTVTQAPLTVTVNDQSRAYGASNPATGAVTLTTGTLYNSDILGNATVSSAASNTSAVGNYTLTPSAQTFSAGSAGNYNISYADGTLAVTRASLTVTANNISKTYGQTLVFAGTEFSSVGLVNGETLSAATLSSSGAAASASVNGGSAYAIAVSNVTGVNGFAASNYNIGYANGSLTVNPAPLGISASGVYSGTTLVVPTSFSVTGLVNGETVNALSSVVVNNANVASANRVTSIQVANGSADMANYALSASANSVANTSTTNTFSLARAALTVTADNAAMFIGETLPGSYNVSYNGFVNGETATALRAANQLTPGVVNNSASGSSGAGSYALTPSGWSADNYSLSYASGDFTIVPANQLLVQMGALTGTYGSVAGLTPTSVQYKSGNSGPVVNLSLGSSLGNNSHVYNDGYGGSVTLTLSPANASFSGSGNLQVNSYQLTGSVGSVTGGNFNGTAVYTGSLAVTPLAVAPSLSNVSKVYDGSTGMNGLSIQLSPASLAGDAVTVTGSGAFASRHVGSNLNYNVTGVLLGGADAGNYVLTSGSSFTGSNGQIVAKTVTITPQASSKTYDGNTSASANLSHFSSLLGVAGDSVTALTVNFDDKNVGTGKTLTPSAIAISDGNGGNNYNIVYANATTGTVTRLNAVTWVGGATGNWFDPANWAGGAVPDLSNVANVLIPSGVTVSFNNTVTAPAQSGPVNIDSLGGASGNLSQSAGTLNVGAGGVTLAALTQLGGILTSQGPVTLGELSQSGGASTFSADLTTSNLSQTNGTLNVTANLTVTADATQQGGSTTVGNLSAANLTVTGGSTNVSGNLSATNLTVSGGSTSVSGNTTASNLTVSGGNVTTAGNLTTSNLSQTNGTLNVTANLTVTADATQQGGSTTVGNLSAANLTVAGGNTNVSGNLSTTNLTVSGGNTSVSGNTTAGNLTVSGGNVTTAGNVTTGNLSQTNGTLNVNNNLNASNHVQSGGTQQVQQNLVVNGSFSQSGGAVVVGAGANISTTGAMQLGNLSVAGNLSAQSSNGSIVQVPGTQMVVSGQAAMQATGNVSLNPGNSFQRPVQIQDQNSQNGQDLTPHLHKVAGGTPVFAKLPTPAGTESPPEDGARDQSPNGVLPALVSAGLREAVETTSQSVVETEGRVLIVDSADKPER